jgi:hypothetical protein
MNWLVNLMESIEYAESPRHFFYWSALSAVSAVVKSNVYLDKHLYKLSPNIYVMLVAKSGLRKGVPVMIAKNLVQEIGNTRIFSGRGSIQGIINELSKAHTMKDGSVIKESCGYLVTSEFASSFVQDPQTFTLLTDLYDGNYNTGEWKNVIKGTGTETLRDVNLTMLSATNMVHFRNTVSDTDISGGFIGRTLIVSADKKQQVNALIRAPVRLFDLKEHTPYLQEISKVKGKFSWNDDAAEMYEKWYQKFSSEIEDSEDKTGTLDRLHDHVLKISMLLSLCRDGNLILLPEDIKNAISSCEMLTLNVKKTVMGHGKSQFAPQTALVLNILMKREGMAMSRKTLLTRVWGDIDANDLDRVIETLVQAGAIAPNRVGSEIVYTLKPEFYEQYVSMRGGST